MVSLEFMRRHSKNLVILDGMTVYHVDHFFGMFSAFNANAIKDSRYIKEDFQLNMEAILELTGKRGEERNKITLLAAAYFLVIIKHLFLMVLVVGF